MGDETVKKLINILELLNGCTFEFNNKEYIIDLPRDYYKNHQDNNLSFWSDNVCITVYAKRKTGWLKMFSLTRFYSHITFRDIEEWNSSLKAKVTFYEEIKKKGMTSLKRLKINFIPLGESVLDQI